MTKKNYNFLNPGERPQVLAEYENIKQAIDKHKAKLRKRRKSSFNLFTKKTSILSADL